MKTGIYMIRNRVNGNCYIGSAAQSFAKRWTLHKFGLRNDRHHSLYLQKSWNVHGEGAFEFLVLFECQPSECLAAEQAFLNVFEPEYNSAVCAGHPSLGRKMSEETKKKIGDANRGRKLPPMSEETKRRMGDSRRGKKRGPMSEEQRQKLSMALKGRALPLERRLRRALKNPDVAALVAEIEKSA
jgi:group I intron endonuclease